jgi:phytoene synthase
MEALYAFARKADDIVDREAPAEVRAVELQRFREQLEETLNGHGDAPISAALHDTVQRFQIPDQHLFDLLDGCAMDLETRFFATWAELREYCHRVASSVGLACLCIWECNDPKATQPAIDCGLALQLTNILRDIQADADLGRFYLPWEDLEQFGLWEGDIFEATIFKRQPNDKTAELIRFEAARARELYESAWQALPLIPQPARRLYWLMHQTYFQLLQKIEREPNVVFQRRVGLSWPAKLWLATRATMGLSIP